VVAFYAGFDGVEDRVGLAVGQLLIPGDTSGQPDVLFAAQRFPTAGDRLEFFTNAGTDGETVIELSQVVEGFDTSGRGAAAAVLDSERGFLYVPSKLSNYIYVLDVRDESVLGYSDANYLDIEALVTINTVAGPLGFRDLAPIPGTDLVVATTYGPDALLVLDMSEVVDDDLKQAITTTAVAALPITRNSEDAGVASDPGANGTSLQFGAGDMALAADGHTLLIPHFMDNSVSVFDLSLGEAGEEIAHLDYIGENPHLVRFSPDGRHAVVANYAGEVSDEGAVSSTLAILDTDPASASYLEVLTWIANQ
jgi:DNA-binding beta-propeller fold protein YncE